MDETPKTEKPEKIFYGSDENGLWFSLGRSRANKGEKIYLRDFIAEHQEMKEKLNQLLERISIGDESDE
jgi:hypothetical protein